MTRAERVMELHAKLYILDRLLPVASMIAITNDGAPLRPPLFRRPKCSLPTILSEMVNEKVELQRQMGGTERRQLDALMRAWRTP